MSKFYIPNNLNLEKHIEKYPTKDIRPFKIIKLAYLLDRISVILVYNKDHATKEFYTPLHAKILQKYIQNYKQYIQYAVDTGIIETNGYYISGEKSIGYRFTKRCST